MHDATIPAVAEALASIDGGARADVIVDGVAERFGLRGAWRRVLAGERSLAFRLDAADGRWFIKLEPGVQPERAEHAAELALEAARWGVPVARPAAARDGRFAIRLDGLVVSASEWVEGSGLRPPVDVARASEIGTAIGRMHRGFAELSPGPELVASGDDPWLTWDRRAMETALSRLASRILDRGTDPHGFDATALDALEERRGWLDAVGQVLSALPPLTRQVGHGDIAAPNLLVDGDRLAAVVDFSNAGPQLLAYELGRIAFCPEIVLSPGGEELSRALLAAYEAENPAGREADVRHARDCAAIQFARSLYPLTERYAGTGKFPEDLDDFWLRRHRTARLLLEGMGVLAGP